MLGKIRPLDWSILRISSFGLVRTAPGSTPSRPLCWLNMTTPLPVEDPPYQGQKHRACGYGQGLVCAILCSLINSARPCALDWSVFVRFLSHVAQNSLHVRRTGMLSQSQVIIIVVRSSDTIVLVFHGPGSKDRTSMATVTVLFGLPIRSGNSMTMGVLNRVVAPLIRRFRRPLGLSLMISSIRKRRLMLTLSPGLLSLHLQKTGHTQFRSETC